MFIQLIYALIIDGSQQAYTSIAIKNANKSKSMTFFLGKQVLWLFKELNKEMETCSHISPLFQTWLPQLASHL